MSDTPKAKKSRGRTQLSLNQRLTKRLSSPQKRILNTESSHSSVINVDSNDCTPPHKKLNLDDSYDSPTNFDNHSPTFLSQTYCPDSPEVGWRWTVALDIQAETNKSRRQDSGISSNPSSSVGITTLKRPHRENSEAYRNKHNDKTRAKLSELHKADKKRSEAILRERLAKLEDQLRSTCSSKILPSQKPVEHLTNNNKDPKNVVLQPVTSESDTLDMVNFSDFDSTFDESMTLENVKNLAAPKPVVNNSNDFDDFFNDTEMDGFLIAATQQVESTLPELTQPEKSVEKSMPLEIPIERDEKNTTPKSSKEKRSSLYMKFFEDDEDDLFASLDDATLLKASQSNKLRSPFQRYKSMPAATSSTSTTAIKSATITSSGTKISENTSRSLKYGTHVTDEAYTTSTLHKAPIKRHVSSHVISHSTKNLHDRQVHRHD